MHADIANTTLVGIGENVLKQREPMLNHIKLKHKKPIKIANLVAN